MLQLLLLDSEIAICIKYNALAWSKRWHYFRVPLTPGRAPRSSNLTDRSRRLLVSRKGFLEASAALGALLGLKI